MNFESKMRDLSLLICTISLVAGFISCDNVKSEQERKENLRNASQRGITETVEIYDQPSPPVRTTAKAYKEITKIESDNSLVETMFDDHGNKTESRYFNSNPVLKMVVLRTKANGESEAVIYGQNGDIKIAPPEIVKSIMKSSAKDIARAVEIKEGVIENQIPAMLAAEKPTPEPATFTLFQNPATETLAPVVKTENVVETEMLSDKLIKSEKETEKKPLSDEDVRPYDIPENTDQK